MRSWRAARGLLRVLALVVPRRHRRDWLEEWRGEMEALERVRRFGNPGRYPTPVGFVVGAIPHALWMRKEEWSMERVIQDLRFALRMLRRSPGFAAVAVLTLALGIGVNASIFSLVNGLVLRDPAGVEAPDRLVQIARSYEDDPRWDNWSWPALQEIRRSGRVFDGVAGYSAAGFLIGEGAEARTVLGDLVTGNYFQVLGVEPVAGRLLGPADDITPGAHPVVVLSWDLWQERFGGDPAVVGRTLRMGGQGYQVLGVTPRGFRGVETVGSPPQLFVPATMHEPMRGNLPFDRWGWSWIQVTGRLADGVSMEQARAAVQVASTRLREADPVNEGIQILLAPGVGLSPSERAEANRISLLLMVIAGLVLLLSCANVANLFVARATTRASEMGVRRALGAGRGRLVGQVGTESLVLSLLAAAVAAPLVWLAGGFLPSFVPYTLSATLRPDGRVAAVLIALGLVAGVLFGAGPAVMLTRRSLAAALRDGGTTGSTGRTRGRDLLVVGQLAVSLGLLASAALLGRSILNANHADPGFEPRGLMVGALNLDLTGRYDRPQALDFYQRLEQASLALPGVEAFTVASRAPFLGPFSRATRAPLDRPGDPSVEIEAEETFVGADYFETMGIPLVRGRTLREPRQETEPVAVINEALARRFWPGEDPVGKQLTGEVPLRVVGVVGDVHERSLRGQALPGVYRPLSQAYGQQVVALLRTPGDPRALVRPFRQAVAGLDPGLPVSGATDVYGLMAGSLGETRTIGLLVGTFAALALLLSLTGLYGLIAYGVSQRVREMGIRMALGARPESLVRMILRRGLILTTLGLVAGLGLALLLGRGIRGLLYGVEATSPTMLGLAAVTLLVASTVAAWIPARRATRVDAVRSLRSE